MSASRHGRWMLVLTCWALLSVVTIGAPLMLLFGWPVVGAAFLCTVIGSLRGLSELIGHREPLQLAPSRSRWFFAMVIAIVLAAIAGTVSATFPSMAFRSNGYALSVVIGPAMFAAIAIGAVRALHSLSPRRLAVLAAITICSWPFLSGIRAWREPFFDLDGHHAVLARWALYTYAASVAVASGAAIGLLMAVNHFTTRTLRAAAPNIIAGARIQRSSPRPRTPSTARIR